MSAAGNLTFSSYLILTEGRDCCEPLIRSIEIPKAIMSPELLIASLPPESCAEKQGVVCMTSLEVLPTIKFYSSFSFISSFRVLSLLFIFSSLPYLVIYCPYSFLLVFSSFLSLSFLQICLYETCRYRW